LPHLDPRRQHESSPWCDRAASLASAAIFVASEEASFITGSQLVVDGGLTAV